MGKKQLKGIRLESNWNTFEIEHPEVKLSKDCRGKFYLLLYLMIII